MNETTTTSTSKKTVNTATIPALTTIIRIPIHTIAKAQQQQLHVAVVGTFRNGEKPKAKLSCT